MNGSDVRLEYQCKKCGAIAPSRAKRCPRCGTEFSAEDESVEEILNELTSLLNGERGEEESEVRTSTGEGPPDKEETDSAYAKPDGKVRYKKVKKWPP